MACLKALRFQGMNAFKELKHKALSTRGQADDCQPASPCRDSGCRSSIVWTTQFHDALLPVPLLSYQLVDLIVEVAQAVLPKSRVLNVHHLFVGGAAQALGEKPEFELKALVYHFHHQSLNPGAFELGVELAPPFYLFADLAKDLLAPFVRRVGRRELKKLEFELKALLYPFS